ncbi:MAG: hypothetical protein AB7T48_02455 [Solirubrobacterales bacterium]
MRRQLLLMLLAFAGGTAIATLLGAVNSGVALSVGAFCFAATVVALILTE